MFKRISWQKTALFSLLLGAVCTRLDAYVPIRWGRTGVPVVWLTGRFPLVFQVDGNTAKGTIPNLEPGNDAMAAIKAAMAAWQDIATASIRFEEPQIGFSESANSKDGINLITMADTPTNRALLGGDKDTGTLALTKLVINVNTGRIIESDIIFNPQYSFSTNLAADTYDLQSILTHELGHALGCDHAVAQNDTMFHQINPGEFFQRHLSVDSIGFATSAYPMAAKVDQISSFGGRVTQEGAGVFGASVTAVELEHNLIYTSLTEPDGSYNITGPVHGKYVLFAEPLDGPAKPDQFISNGGYNSYYQNLITSFRSSFIDEYDFSASNSDFKQDRESRREINFMLSSKPADLNIDRLGRGNAETGSGYLSAGAVVVHQGEILSLLIGGAGTWRTKSTNDIRIIGSGISIDEARGIKILRNVYGNEVGISLLIRVAQDAIPGSRTITLTAGDETVASTGGIVVAPRTLPVRTLYIPYLETSRSQYTGIALANPSRVPAAVRITGRDSQGALLYGRDALVPADVAIGAGAQTARVVSQIFNLPPELPQSGSLTIESDRGEVQGFFLSGDYAGTYLDGAEAFTRSYRELCFLDVLQNAETSTEIHLVNSRESAQDVQLRLIGPDGMDISPPFRITIPAHGKIGESVRGLFSADGEIKSAHIVATAARDALVGFGLIRQGRTTFGLNAQPLGNAAALLYSPHMAIGNFGVSYSTRLNIVNVGDSAAEIEIAFFAENGSAVSNARAQSAFRIAAGGQLSVDLRSHFGLDDTAATQGSIKVVAQEGARLLANILFGDGDPTNAPLTFGAVLALTASGESNVLFSQVTQAQGYYTGLAFMAPEAADLTIEVYGPEGSLVGAKDLSLSAGARMVRLLQDLLPSTRDQQGGYIKILSSKPVISFELIGATSGQFLVAVPPQKLLN